MSFQNTFAPLIENQELTVDNIIRGLFIGCIKYEDIPQHIKSFVDEEIKKRIDEKPVELEPEPDATQEARPPQKQFATGKTHNIPAYLDKALDDYLKKRNSPNEDYEHLNYTIERIVETEDGHWVTIKGEHIKIEKGQTLDDAIKAKHEDKGIDVKNKPLDVGQKPLMQPDKKKGLFNKFKPKKKFAGEPAFEGRDFEPIIKSSAPTAEHVATAAKVFARYPAVFSRRREFLVHQSWAADQLRSVHEPVAKALRTDLENNFPNAVVTYRIKKRYNMLEKLGRKSDLYHTVQDLTDVSGVMAIPNSVAEQQQILDHLKRTTDIKEIENYIDQPKNGYRAIHLLAKDRTSGVVTEVQIKTPRQARWAKWDHDYEYKPPTTEIEKLVNENKDIIHQYSQAMSDYFFSLDKGETNLKMPDCPEIIKQQLECLE